MKVLYCEQCDEVMTEDSFGLELFGLYFCSETCLHDYVDMNAGLISEADFELYGEEPEEDDEEETD